MVMARMDYVIICQVIDQLNRISMTDDELSFLLGKPNNYVFGFIIKPSDKNRFHEDQVDLLPYILGCGFEYLIPDGTESSDIQLYHTKAIDDEDYKGFSHITYASNGNVTRVIWKKRKASKRSMRKTNRALLDLLKQWIADSYFDQKRDALEIYKKLTSETVFTFSELEKCLKILCRSRSPALQKKSIDGVLKYWS